MFSQAIPLRYYFSVFFSKHPYLSPALHSRGGTREGDQQDEVRVNHILKKNKNSTNTSNQQEQDLMKGVCQISGDGLRQEDLLE